MNDEIQDVMRHVRDFPAACTVACEHFQVLKGQLSTCIPFVVFISVGCILGIRTNTVFSQKNYLQQQCD